MLFTELDKVVNAVGLLPFTTRSGQMALRLSSPGDADETASALQKLRAVMARLETGPQQEPG